MHDSTYKIFGRRGKRIKLNVKPNVLSTTNWHTLYRHLNNYDNDWESQIRGYYLNKLLFLDKFSISEAEKKINLEIVLPILNGVKTIRDVLFYSYTISQHQLIYDETGSLETLEIDYDKFMSNINGEASEIRELFKNYVKYPNISSEEIIHNVLNIFCDYLSNLTYDEFISILPIICLNRDYVFDGGLEKKIIKKWLVNLNKFRYYEEFFKHELKAINWGGQKIYGNMTLKRFT